jgi:hypothetical protein
MILKSTASCSSFNQTSGNHNHLINILHFSYWAGRLKCSLNIGSCPYPSAAVYGAGVYRRDEPRALRIELFFSN